MRAKQDEAEVFSDLLLAMLAVNSWELDKVGALLPQLRDSGLTDANLVSGMSFEKVFSNLVASGYKRGDYIVSLLADRVISAGNAFSDTDFEPKLLEMERAKDVESLKQLLQPIKGVGPKVFQNFLLLRGLK